MGDSRRQKCEVKGQVADQILGFRDRGRKTVGVLVGGDGDGGAAGDVNYYLERGGNITVSASGRNCEGVIASGYPCAYLHACVERHLQHHGDTYYQEGKGVRDLIGIGMSRVEKARIGADGTVTVLAQVHAALQVGKRKRKVKPLDQPMLL